MRTCVRCCGSGWMYCALFCFYRLSLFYSVRRGPYIFARLRFAFYFGFYFGFLSLVVRTAELDGGCMRLSRDHMWVLSPLILIPFLHFSCFLPTLLQTLFFLSLFPSIWLSLSLFALRAFAWRNRSLNRNTYSQSRNAIISFTKDMPTFVIRISLDYFYKIVIRFFMKHIYWMKTFTDIRVKLKHFPLWLINVSGHWSLTKVL